MKHIPIYKVVLERSGTQVCEDSKVVDSPSVAVDVLRQYIGDSDREQFVMMALDARGRIIGINTVSVGTVAASLVHPREVFKTAISLNAVGIVVAHNHPSGDPAPSMEDKDATRRLSKAGEILGIPLQDHVIIGAPGKHFSFKESGLL